VEEPFQELTLRAMPMSPYACLKKLHPLINMSIMFHLMQVRLHAATQAGAISSQHMRLRK
jgi:hypothetical protein